MVRLKAPFPWVFKIGKDMKRNEREKSKTDVLNPLLMVRHWRISRCLPTSPISSVRPLVRDYMMAFVSLNMDEIFF